MNKKWLNCSMLALTKSAELFLAEETQAKLLPYIPEL